MKSIESNLIKSFVRRAGKITAGQQKAIDQLMPKYGITYSTKFCNLNEHFNRNSSKIIEIGFGMGHATIEIANANPDVDYLAIEVHPPGVGSLLKLVNNYQIHNLKIIQHDAVEVLKNMIMDSSISGFHIYFPDPWHKKRHHKRRLIQAGFIQILVSKLKPKGYIHISTDWENYAEHILETLQNNVNLSNTAENNQYISRPISRPLTKFESRGLKLGHKVWDVHFTRKIIKDN